MPGGRPKKQIDYDLVAKMAQIACTEEEIAAMLDVSVRKLQKDKEFIRVYQKGLENARSSLCRWQFKAASQGNVTMQIWLGKQMLGQRDPDKKKQDWANEKQGETGVTIVNDLPPAVPPETQNTMPADKQPDQTENANVGQRLEPTEQTMQAEQAGETTNDAGSTE